jgi:hypothetical protein
VCCCHSIPCPLQMLFGFTLAHASEIGMLLITTFVEPRVVAGRSRTRTGSPQAISRRTCCAVALRRTARSGHGMESVNQTRSRCVNQKEKTHSKPFAAWHGRGMAWARHAMCESAFTELRTRSYGQECVADIASSLTT